jgi:spore coat protein U-like protein
VEMQATVSIHGCVDDGSGTDVSYSIAISTGGSSSYGARAMAGPGDQLLYNLYTDATYGVVWGDGTGGSMTVDGAFSLPGVTSATHTAYGRIPRQQPVAAGAYSDTLGVTITY